MRSGRKRSLRWRGFNYATPSTYHVTVCLQGRHCRLGQVVDGKVELNAAGTLVEELWMRIPEAFPHVVLGTFVVMPNHLHGLVRIQDLPQSHADGLPPDLGRVVGWWKSQTTRAYGHRVKAADWPRFDRRLWQLGYHDHVIRDEDDQCRAEGYILRNPRMWDEDPNNPERSP